MTIVEISIVKVREWEREWVIHLHIQSPHNNFVFNASRFHELKMIWQYVIKAAPYYTNIYDTNMKCFSIFLLFSFASLQPQSCCNTLFTMFYEGNIVITQIIFRWSSIPGRIGIWKCWFFAKGGKPEKNSRSKGENQQQTQLTYDAKYDLLTLLKDKWSVELRDWTTSCMLRDVHER
jgi:hypothetical protein